MRVSHLRTFLLATLVLVGCGGGGANREDGGTDSGPPDSGPECTSDAQCDDALYCNGTERCSGGQCVAGTLVVCDDGVSCTIDTCSEARLACVSRAADADGDGHGSAACVDGGGTPLGDDCDDADPNRFPGNLEVCDPAGHDEDCDYETFGDVDADADGYPAATCCNLEPTGSHCGNDCDDGRTSVRPGAIEVCNLLDDDCNGSIDDGIASTQYPDADFDGFGAIGSTPVAVCPGTPGYASQATDCDDDTPEKRPGQLELCDNVDNDCDSIVDENPTSVNWYLDADGDRFGDPNAPPIVSCVPLPGRSILATDCDDTTASRNPAATEICDGIDQNCDGVANFALGAGDFEDDDGDGFVDIRCGAIGTDCDDNNANVGVGGVEACNGLDDNCNGEIDEGTSDRTWYQDLDRDGFGSLASGSTYGCAPPVGFVSNDADCDDTDMGRAPDQDELCNGEDDDCDGQVDDNVPAALCPVAQGYGVCAGGGCAIGGCDPGYGDCDGVATNGCEAPLNTLSNCGSCTNTCTAPTGAMLACTGSPRRCTLSGCGAGTANCDGVVSNGCETNTLIDANHCGSCAPCSLANAIALCEGGICAIGRCVDGFADCDGVPTNGCETATTADIANCGGCGITCSNANGAGVAACSIGTCVLAGCNPGFDDCDGDPTNGCEADLASTSNCGTCGNVCGIPANGTATCTAGACAVATCSGSYDDCDGRFGNGCETDVNTSAAHCGGCGNACGDANSQPTCVSGSCATGTCTPGYADCTGADGLCETDITADAAHCGACGAPCVLPNAVEACSAAQCVVAGCTGSQGDCDGVDANGCETDVTSDAANCGACAHACGVGGSCASARCSPVLQVTFGANSTCVRRQNGNVACAGDNSSNQLLTGDTLAVSGYRQLPNAPIQRFGAGAESACAVQNSSDLYCWGDNTYLQTGTASAGVQLSPVLAASDAAGIVEVAHGFHHVCYRNGLGQVWCFGRAFEGQTGQGVMAPHQTPVQVVLPGPASQITSGANFTCAVVSGGQAYCWGSNTSGEIGLGFTSSSEPPTAVTGSVFDYVQLRAGFYHACGLRSNGQVYCWGNNGANQVSSSASPSEPPVRVSISRVQSLVVAYQTSCAMTDLGLFCWGSNAAKLISSSAATSFASPQRVTGVPSTATAFGSGIAERLCIIESSGASVSCWGDNTSGAVLGSGAGTITAPTRIVSLSF